MKVKTLIEKLNQLPPNAEVYHLWDGEPRTMINIVYLARCGKVITADYEEFCYSTENRPVNAPTSKDDPYWKTDSRQRKTENVQRTTDSV